VKTVLEATPVAAALRVLELESKLERKQSQQPLAGMLFGNGMTIRMLSVTF
jgi:hypothetical protein